MADTDSMKANARYSPFLNAETGISQTTNPELYYMMYGKKIDSVNGSVSLAKQFSTGTTVAAGTGYTSSKMITGDILGGFVPSQNFDVSSPYVFATIQQGISEKRIRLQ